MYEKLEQTSGDLLHEDTPDWLKQVVFEEGKNFDQRPDTHNGVMINILLANPDDPWNPWPACKNEFFLALEVLFSKEKKDSKEQTPAISFVPSNFYKSLNRYQNLALVYGFAEKFYRKILLLTLTSSGQLMRRNLREVQVDQESKSKFEKIVLGALPENQVNEDELSTACLGYTVFIERFRWYLLNDDDLYNTFFLDKVNSFSIANSLSLSRNGNATSLIACIESLKKAKQELEAGKAAQLKQKELSVKSAPPASPPPSTGPSSIRKFWDKIAQFFKWVAANPLTILKYTLFSPWTFGRWTAAKLDKYDNRGAALLSFVLKLIFAPGELFKNIDAWISKNKYDSNWGRLIKAAIVATHVAIWMLIGIFAPPLLGQMGAVLAAEFLPGVFSALEGLAWSISAVQTFSALCTLCYMGIYHFFMRTEDKEVNDGGALQIIITPSSAHSPTTFDPSPPPQDLTLIGNPQPTSSSVLPQSPQPLSPSSEFVLPATPPSPSPPPASPPPVSPITPPLPLSVLPIVPTSPDAPEERVVDLTLEHHESTENPQSAMPPVALPQPSSLPQPLLPVPPAPPEEPLQPSQPLSPKKLGIDINLASDLESENEYEYEVVSVSARTLRSSGLNKRRGQSQGQEREPSTPRFPSRTQNGGGNGEATSTKGAPASTFFGESNPDKSAEKSLASATIVDSGSLPGVSPFLASTLTPAPAGKGGL